ncbi:hypothetical protein AAC387_Pa05g1173 [Persea americana]
MGLGDPECFDFEDEVDMDIDASLMESAISLDASHILAGSSDGNAYMLQVHIGFFGTHFSFWFFLAWI